MLGLLTRFRRAVRLRSFSPPYRLHVGSGASRLAGWVNIDIRGFPGVDLVLDVTRGLPFSEVEAIYAEHFLEHLALEDALRFLAESHRVLAPGGVIRLSTPNLDWVMRTHYSLGAPGEPSVEMALRINRAFFGWGHRFLWNQEFLGSALGAVGFGEIEWCRYGESSRSLFRGLERHETYTDNQSLPHVLICEARKGGAPAQPGALELTALLTTSEREFLRYARSRY